MTNASNKSRTAAFLLCTFFGPLGAHRFYAGRTVSAVVMLIMSITGILFVVSMIMTVIDWVMLLIGNFEDKDGKEILEW